VFPSRGGRPLSNMSMEMLLRRMKVKVENVTVHGFRSSFRDWAAEETPFAREIAEAALAHVWGMRPNAPTAEEMLSRSDGRSCRRGRTIVVYTRPPTPVERRWSSHRSPWIDVGFMGAWAASGTQGTGGTAQGGSSAWHRQVGRRVPVPPFLCSVPLNRGIPLRVPPVSPVPPHGRGATSLPEMMTDQVGSLHEHLQIEPTAHQVICSTLRSLPVRSWCLDAFSSGGPFCRGDHNGTCPKPILHDLHSGSRSAGTGKRDLTGHNTTECGGPIARSGHPCRRIQPVGIHQADLGYMDATVSDARVNTGHSKLIEWAHVP
jgi:hypothetical protein